MLTHASHQLPSRRSGAHLPILMTTTHHARCFNLYPCQTRARTPGHQAPTGQALYSTRCLSTPLRRTSNSNRNNAPTCMHLSRYISSFLLYEWLLTSYQLGSLPPGLSQADLATRLYHLAVVYSDGAERRRIAKEEGVSNLKELFRDLQI